MESHEGDADLVPGEAVEVPNHGRVPTVLDRWRDSGLRRFLSRYWQTVVFVLAMLLLVWASWVAYHTAQDVKEVQRRTCEATVSSRSDLRALLQDFLGPSTNENTKAFLTKELNERIPSLHCTVDGVIVKETP